MAPKKLELNRGLRSVSGVVGAITGRSPGEQGAPPLDKPEPPVQPAESAPAGGAPEPQQRDAGHPPAHAADPALPQEDPERAAPKPPRKSLEPEVRPVEAGRDESRRGRPPGQSDAESVTRKKVTLMIRTDLVKKYNKWSWRAECHVGRLYERALEDYYQRNALEEGK